MIFDYGNKNPPRRKRSRQEQWEIDQIRRAHHEKTQGVARVETMTVNVSELKATVAGNKESAPNKESVSSEVPTNWQHMSWPALRDLAMKLSGGKEMTSRAEARAIVAARAPK